MIFARNNFETVNGINYVKLREGSKSYVAIKCEYCGNEYEVKYGEHEYILNANGKKHHFCSYTCREKYRKQNQLFDIPKSIKQGERLW